MIDVIWDTATDDTLGEDAKVTILATGMEDDLRAEVEKDVHRDEDDFYEDLIPKLYKSVKKEKPTMKGAIAQELPGGGGTCTRTNGKGAALRNS